MLPVPVAGRAMVTEVPREMPEDSDWVLVASVLTSCLKYWTLVVD